MRRLITAVLVAALLAACAGDDDGGDTPTTTGATATEPTTGPATSEPITTVPPTTAPPTTLPPTPVPATSSPPTAAATGEVGDFDDPVLASVHTWEGIEFCAVLPTEDGSLNEADFGNAAGPAEPLGNAPASEPACLLQGVNVGEISFSVTPRDRLPERATERASTDGEWALLDGNSSYVYCDQDEAIDDPACALFVAIDDEHWLSIFVFMPTNDLDDLAEMTRAIGSIALSHLPAD